MKTTPITSVGIVHFEFTSLGSNVIDFRFDSNRVAVATRNSRGLPAQVIAKVKPSIDTIGYIYALRTPTFSARALDAAADSTAGYAIVAPRFVTITKGSYQKVRE